MSSKKFTFHVLGLPHTITNKDFTACAYTQKAWKFCKMMGERGHTIYHYGHEESNAPYAENVTVITNEVWKKVYGTHDYKSKLFTYNTKDEAYQTFYKNAIEEIGKRKQKNDFILPFWGAGVRPICDAHLDLITVEPGIGYAAGHWANWKVFESYAIYHAYYGLQAVGTCMQKNYDVVIPNYFDLEEFEFNDKKEDYFLYLGRVYDGKGVNIAIQVTEYLGYKLKIAGQIDSDGPYKDKKFPPHVEFIGYADSEKRKELMKNAKGSLLASQYLEPFGGVQIENLLCGTPTITSDWGSFSENNINGVTGYRCRTFDDYLQAAIKINNGEIDFKACREHGEKFSLENVAPMYEKYFQDVLNVYVGKGWYEITDSRKKFFFDCGTHLFQGFQQFKNKIGIEKDWNVYCFESNPDVFKKSKTIYQSLSNEGYTISHQNVAVSDSNGKVKVNRILHNGEYTHLGSNILDNPPPRDIKWDDNFEYAKDTVEVDSIRLSDVIKSNCKKEDFVVVKLDIEGSEFKVLDDIIQSKVYKVIDKIYVEYHSRFFENQEEYNIKIKKYETFFKENRVHIQTDGDEEVWTI